MRLRARRNWVTVFTGCSDCMPPPSADDETTALGPQIALSSLPRPLFGSWSVVTSLLNASGSSDWMPRSGRQPAALLRPIVVRSVSSCVGGGVAEVVDCPYDGRAPAAIAASASATMCSSCPGRRVMLSPCPGIIADS